MTRPSHESTEDITPYKLGKMLSFANCHCPATECNMQQAREYLKTTLGALLVEKEQSLSYLGMLEFKKNREHQLNGDGKAFDAAETAHHTIRHKQREIMALTAMRHEGMGAL